MKIFINILLILFSFFTFAINLSADIDQDIKSELLDNNDTKLKINSKSKAEWKIYGFFQLHNQFDIPPLGEGDEYDVIKLESRLNCNMKYGTDLFHVKSILDVYFYPDSLIDNAPHESGRIEAREFYFSIGRKLRLKLGKQLFNWGAADLFQISNYLDQPDQRELFIIDKNDKNIGVFALSLKYLIKEFAIECAVTPTYNPVLNPDNNSYWAEDYEPLFSTDIIEAPTDTKSFELKNSSFAIRFGGTVGELDFHISYYNGFNRNVILNSELKGTTSSNYIEKKPYYEKIQTVGFDMSLNIGRVAIRSEVTFTPDMVAIKKINETDLNNAKSLLSTNNSTQQITTIDNVPQLSFVIGADFKLWGQNSSLLIEWMQSLYLKNNSEYSKSRLTDIIFLRLKDSFFDSRLTVQLGGIVMFEEDETVAALGYDIAWNFQNGLTISNGIYFFLGMVYLKAKMAF